MDTHQRTRVLLGEERFHQLTRLRVTIVGVGGVGSHAAQALVSMGCRRLLFIDNDVIESSNANRHIQAQRSRIGLSKVEALKSHLEETFSDLDLRCAKVRFGEDELHLLNEPCHVILDCVDDINAKLLLIESAQDRDIPILSALGMGNHLDPSKLIITTLYKSEGCPLAKRLRREAHRRELDDVPVVLSTESPQKREIHDLGSRRSPASCYLVPAACGLMMAHYVVSQFTTFE